jgi:hypothetical protein
VHGQNPALQTVLGRDFKGAVSPPLYLSGIVLSFWAPWAALLCYLVVTLLWLVPDRRIEKMVAQD